MRALVQRVREASVTVDGRIAGAVGPGLLVLAGIGSDDGDDDREWLARKIVALRIFDDDAGTMNRSVVDAGGGILAVSQFTLFASTKKAPAHRGQVPHRRRWPRRGSTVSSPRSPPRSANPSQRASSARRCRSRSSTTGR